jgi:hypothetical protein
VSGGVLSGGVGLVEDIQHGLDRLPSLLLGPCSRVLLLLQLPAQAALGVGLNAGLPFLGYLLCVQSVFPVIAAISVTGGTPSAQ